MEIGRKIENLGTIEVDEIGVLESERKGRCCGILAENNRKEEEIAIPERKRDGLFSVLDCNWGK